MKRHVISAHARLDLISIWNHLAEHASLDVADKVLRQIRNEIHRVVAMPGIGHTRPELRDDSLRIWRASSYLIIYNPETTPLSIVRVVHGAQDLASLFAK